jgi:FkbM family methyltransferase
VRFVDCGAYRGDTLEELLNAAVPIEASAHFEPDLDNFAILVGVARRRRGHATTLLWPCAVSHGVHRVAFSDGLDEGSRVSAAATGTVPAVGLDDVLAGWRPSFIKMDIEGSEVEALEGARELIAANRPSLAICVYHQPDHLWRIPLLLASWPSMAGYRYFLRAHGFDGFDTVLYARPDAATGHSANEVRS